jgi:hypothetical protein
MSTDELPELPDDVQAALDDAKGLTEPGEEVRARMRLRLANALPPSPGGGGDGGGGAGAAGALPRAPLWAVGAALVVGGVAGYLVPRAPVERVVLVPAAVSVASAPARAPSAASSAFEAALPSIETKDLPSVASAPARVASDLAAERALLDVARTALGRGDGANALSACDEHGKRFPRGALAEEREAIAVQALVLEHRTEDARARATLFRKTHPRSILLPAVLAAAGVEP